MGCTPCARRRKAAQKAREKKAAEGKKLQAAAIGAALAVTEVVGKAIGIETEQAISDSYAGRVEALESVDALFDDGIHGEVEDEQGKPEQSHATGPDAGSDG